jgi:tetratricopeptide (TPR) repeat protein
MASMYSLRLSIGLAVTLLLSSNARAQVQVNQQQDPWERGVAAQQMQRAHLHFQLGLTLHRQLLLQEAATEYERALSHWKHPKIYFYLSRVWMKLERPVAAYEALRDALRWGRRGLARHDYEMARQMQNDLLGTRIAELEVICEEAGSEVTLDGASLFIGPAQRRVIVSVGKHQIVARKPAHRTETHAVALSPGEQKRVEVELRRVAEIRRSIRLPPDWKYWAIAGSGAAVATMGGLLHWSAQRNFADYDGSFDERCRDGCSSSEIPDLTDQLHAARRQKQLAVASYVAGGVTMACGLILAYLNKPIPDKRRSFDSRASGISLAPGWLSPGVGVSAEIRF